ncbi:hypothetical protein FGIG_05982 [Fasciola gigantica]|uniref:Uncharacterized protein n=1 Tax=Fasciola gigantica TaxID=46835 RepID=A0A504Z0Q6_FASGI|nr:hypothetical protein FGIG_05982 [Fasciola gigantica]
MAANHDTQMATLTEIARLWNIEKNGTLYEISIALAERLADEPIRKNIIEAFRIVHRCKLPCQEFPVVIVERLIECLKMPLIYDYKLKLISLLHEIAAEEKGLRNILRLRGEVVLLRILNQSEEVLKPDCFQLLIRLAESLRGRVAIIRALTSPDQLLVHLKKSKNLDVFTLQLLTLLLGVPTARSMFDVPSLHSYLRESSLENTQLDIYKQLVGWLIRLPGTRLVDHFAKLNPDPITAESQASCNNAGESSKTPQEETG